MALVLRNVAELERSDNVADRSHAFAVLKRGYTTVPARCCPRSGSNQRSPIDAYRLVPAASLFLCGFRGGGCYQ